MVMYTRPRDDVKAVGDSSGIAFFLGSITTPPVGFFVSFVSAKISITFLIL